jgi:hypothetical protein
MQTTGLSYYSVAGICYNKTIANEISKTWLFSNSNYAANFFVYLLIRTKRLSSVTFIATDV